MSLAEAAAGAAPSRPKPPTKIDVWLASLPESERDGALKILRNSEWTTSAARRLFGKNGLDVSWMTLSNYREKLHRDAR